MSKTKIYAINIGSAIAMASLGWGCAVASDEEPALALAIEAPTEDIASDESDPGYTLAEGQEACAFERAPEDAVGGTSLQDAPQGLALDLETANNLNGCCFKCTATGQLQYKVFGGQHCQIVANNRCQTWGKGTGFDAHQCAWQ